MAKRKRKQKSAEELNDENEFLKMKMMAEFGGDFVGSDDIPPDVENQFLKQIMDFHKQHENSKMTTVYKYIGEPEYNHVHDLSDKEVKAELKKLRRIMEKHGVGLDVLAPTPDREVYRFITEELFKHEIEDMKMKGWMNQFIYEEFHPNAEYDVKQCTFYALQSVFSSKGQFMDDHFAEEMKDDLGLTTDVEELKEKALAFRMQFADVALVQHDFVKLEIDKEAGKAVVVCEVIYKTQKEAGKRSRREITTVELDLERSQYSDSWWEVKRFSCPVLL